MIANSNFYSIVPTNFNKLPKVQPLDFNLEYQMFKTYHTDRLNSYTLPQVQISSSSDESKTAPKDSKKAVKSHLPFKSIQLLSDFKLALESQFETTIYKGKYFSFKVSLDQLTELTFPASESLEIELLVYNEENMIILKNMRGQDILKGNYIQNMHFYKPENKHVAYFKVQITEVSSHYIGKSLKFQVKARNTEFLSATGWKIKPIWIENITVKAKKSN